MDKSSSFYYDTIFDYVIAACNEGLIKEGLMAPLIKDDNEALTYAYHTMEEVWEVVRELPRKSWKHQEVDRDKLRSELSDVFIQYCKLLAYCGLHLNDIYNDVDIKLKTPRLDWKSSEQGLADQRIIGYEY